MDEVMLIVSFSLSVISVLLIIVMTWSFMTLDEYLELKLGNSEEKFKAARRERQLDSARRALEFKEDFKQILTEEIGAFTEELGALKKETELVIKLQKLKEEAEQIIKLQEKIGALKKETEQIIKLQELQEKER